MYYYSKLNHRKIIHTKECFIAKHFDPETTGTFETLREAFAAGYRLCRRCNPIAKQYRKEEDSLVDYCYRNGMSFYYNDRNFKVSSPVSKWLITVSPAGKMQLYHKNTKTLDTDAMSIIPGYHNQRVYYNTLAEYLEYIKGHDFYRNMHPEQVIKKHVAKEPPRKGTKRWYKEQRKMKNRERRHAIRNVLDIIESFDSNYSVCAAG